MELLCLLLNFTHRVGDKTFAMAIFHQVCLCFLKFLAEAYWISPTFHPPEDKVGAFSNLILDKGNSGLCDSLHTFQITRRRVFRNAG